MKPAPLLLLIALGCGGDDVAVDGSVPEDGAPDAVVDAGPPVPPEVGQLLIEELYYTGAVPSGGTDHYFSDQFIELVNVSDGPLDLSGVYIGEVFGIAGEINPGDAPDSFRTDYPDDVVMTTVWRIPDGVELEPGGHLVVAHDGRNHRPFSVVDLSGADFEAYVEASGGDEDSPTVANLELVHFRGGFDWLMTVFGPSVVVVEPSATLGEVAAPGEGFRSAPTGAVIDAIETLMGADSGAFKRLPDALDTGHAWVSGTYTGESLHRKRDGDGYQDTNDSGADFEVGAPDPGAPITPAGVTGEPWVELGAGTDTFAPLVDGDEVELVAGIQGGWHLDVTTRLGGFGPEGVLLEYAAVSASGELISFETQAILQERSVIADGDAWVRVGDRIVLDVVDPSEVVGTTVTLRVSATLDAASASDERTVTVVEP